MKFIGIDLGTSAAKLILADEEMNILKTITKSYPLDFRSNGYSEQNPEDWLKAVKEGINELGTADVAAIGVGGQMHGLVMLGENDEVLRPAILWNDTRTAKETDYLNDVFGKEKLHDLTGNIAFAGFTAPKILWVKENEPEIFAKCKKICLPKDYINYMLTGTFATDVSDASGMLLFDVKNRCWSKEMLDLCGISEDMLPKVFESYEVIGETDFGAKVCAGAGDNAAAAIGTNTITEGQCNISLGTSGTVFIPTDEFVSTSNPALHSFCHANGKYHLMGCILTAASANKWLVEEVFDTLDYSKNEKDLNPELNIYFMPYMAGERCPHNDASVRGAFIGLSHDTKREDLTQAVYEGVSFAIRDCIELVDKKITKATVCGGGTKSKLWMKILSNVLGIELSVINNEGPALGGAILALRSTGKNIDINPKIREVISPDKDLLDIYDEKYIKYSAIYPALKDFFKEQ